LDAVDPWRVLQVAALAFPLSACGRLGFSDLGLGDGDARVGDASGADAFAAVLLGSDDFGRTLASGWGTADLGGTWSVYNPNNAALSVGSGHGKVAFSTTLADADFHLVTATALDGETRAIVSFDRVPTTGSYSGIVSIRWVTNGNDYRFHVDVLVGGSVQPFLEVGNASGYTNIATGTSTITVTANAGVELSVTATGASPTTLCGKVWLAGSAEPSACTASVQDSTPNLQLPGLSFLITQVNGTAAPTVSFSTFRYLRIGPQ
jgi:hypothetical protein